MGWPVAMRETFEDIVNPSHTALLVIDVQNDFCKEECQAMLPRLERLIDTAREAGVYVVYIQNVVLPGGLSNSPADTVRRKKFGMKLEVTVDGTPGCQIVDEVAPRPGEPVVRKHRMNSFLGTDLDQLLRCRGIESIVCTGVATNGCVLNTSYAGICQDYYVVVVEDCVATGHRGVHDLALRLMQSAMHYVIPAEQLIQTWRDAAVAATALAGYAGQGAGR